MAQNNRELSQFSSFLEVNNTNKNIGITTGPTPYVGIGTTNPTAKLHVVGDANVSGVISATGYYLNGNELIDAALQTWDINGSNIYRSTGNVGIGSSIPGSKLTVVGDITATGTITGSGVSVSGISTASRFVSTVTSGTAPLTVTSTTQVSNLNASLLAGKTPPSGDIVGTTDTQTLTNKTLTSPVISAIVNGAFTSNVPSVNGTLVSTGSTGTVTSNMIADLNIVNDDVAVGAGITYGKLSLTNSILAADIVVGAGITYGKLNLTGFVTNADIATGAGISVSKLSANTISGITLGSNLETLTFGTYLTGTSYNGSTAVTIATNATSANTTSTIVARDGSGDFTAGTITATNFTATQNIVASGNLTVNGTQTLINTTSLEVADNNIGIGSTSSPTDVTADGGGFTIYGSTNKTLTWERDTGCFEYNQPNKFKGVIETVAVGQTYALSAGRVVLELDVRNATTYTHNLTNGSVGIVSFKNMPADTGVSNGTTITVIFTQNSAGTGNTTAATGIGTNISVIGFEDGATVAGISTRALVGSGTTLTLSTTASDRDFVSFFVHYTGGTNTTASSYQVYATKNGGFR